MTSASEPQAGSSTGLLPGCLLHKATQKPRSAHPDHARLAKRKRPPHLPAPPTTPSQPGGTSTTHPHLPIKVLQGAGTRRTDNTKAGYGREVVFVTRKMGLGALMGRCRSLVVDEGYTHLILHALGAAIPHALLLLHALLDMLPFPRGPRGLWYEIRTGTEECVDDVEPGPSGVPATQQARRGKGKRRKAAADGAVPDPDSADSDPATNPAQAAGQNVQPDNNIIHSWLADIGSIQAVAPIKQVRLTSSVHIDVYIGPKPSSQPTAPPKGAKQSKPGEGRSRPNKARRGALLARRKADEAAKSGSGAAGSAPAADEEDMMNAMMEQEEEEEEEIEEVEKP